MNAYGLAARQQDFLECLLDDAQALPAGWDEQGFFIYRNAYRQRVVDAIRDTFPRTERWVGDEAFKRAAIHHAIQHPPATWTLDAVGEGMPGTLAALFVNDPEVAELAWLEWAMHLCFVSADHESLDAAGFRVATASFAEVDWTTMQLEFVPGTQVAPTRHRVDSLWCDLAEADAPTPGVTGDYRGDDALACVVWRHGLTPVCASVPASEGRVLDLILNGMSYGDACAALADDVGTDAAVAEAGAMLGRWIHNGMLGGVRAG